MRIFTDFGIPFDRDAYARTYSPNWYHTFECVGLPRERWSDADERWLAYFAEETVALIDGVREALDALGQRGIRRGIVTSGGRDRVSRELAAHGVHEHFEQVVYGNETERRKPHPDALHLCLERLGVPPQEAAYVGDSPEDVLMARAANVFAVAVPGGYPNRAALEAAEPNAMAENVGRAVALLLECGSVSYRFQGGG